MQQLQVHDLTHCMQCTMQSGNTHHMQSQFKVQTIPRTNKRSTRSDPR